MTELPTMKFRWLRPVRGPLFLPELRHIPPPNTPLMITSQHPPRIVIQTLKRSWNGRGLNPWGSHSLVESGDVIIRSDRNLLTSAHQMDDHGLAIGAFGVVDPSFHITIVCLGG